MCLHAGVKRGEGKGLKSSYMASTLATVNAQEGGSLPPQADAIKGVVAHWGGHPHESCDKQKAFGISLPAISLKW